jgi:hypothetical protein
MSDTDLRRRRLLIGEADRVKVHRGRMSGTGGSSFGGAGGGGGGGGGQAGFGNASPNILTLPIAGVPAALAVTAQPATIASGSTMANVTIKVIDAYGQVCAVTAAVSIGIANNPGPGVVKGTLNQVTVGGVATFNDLVMNAPIAKSGYTFLATSGTLAPVITSSFGTTGSSGTLRTVPSTGDPVTDGTTFLTAMAAASSGDIVFLGPGLFDTGTSQILQVNGVHVVGSGMNGANAGGTTIQMEHQAGGHASFKVGVGSCVTDLYVFSNLTTGASPSGFPLGKVNADGAFAGACYIQRVTVDGTQDVDAFYFRSGTPAPIITNCVSRCAFDAFTFTNIAATLIIADTTLISFGPNIGGPGTGHAIGLGGSASMDVELRNCTLSVANQGPASTPGSEQCYGIWGQGPSGQKCRIFAGSVKTTNVGISTPGTIQLADYGVTTSGNVESYGAEYQSTYNDGTGTIVTANILVITQQPTTTVHNVAIAPALTVAFQDGAGSTQTGATRNIEIWLKNVATGVVTPAGGTGFSATSPVAAVSGVATFSDATVAAAGTYQLIFTALGMPSVTSSSFTVT